MSKSKNNNSEEYDVNEYAWRLYGLLYKDLFNGKDYEIEDEKGKRPYIKATLEHSGKTVLLELSGETDFNFSSKKIYGWGKSREQFFKYFSKELKAKDKVDFLKQIDGCRKKHHSPENISLMPKSGSLNIVKKSIGNDRLDTFVWALNEYYENNNEMIFSFSSNENYMLLKGYLDLFDDVYDYCKTMYFISDKLTRELINSGCKAINSAQRAKEYMDLAVRFWEEKQAKIKTLSIGEADFHPSS